MSLNENKPGLVKLAVFDSGSCVGCELELAQVLVSDKLPLELTTDAKNADIVVITGAIANSLFEEFKRFLGIINPKRQVIVSFGICPVTGNVFRKVSHAPLDNFIKVDIKILGCPPKPDQIVKGLNEAIQLVSSRGGIKPGN